MIIQTIKPALLVMAAVTLLAVASVTGCNENSKKTESVTTKIDTTVKVTPEVIDTSILDTLTTRPVKTPN